MQVIPVVGGVASALLNVLIIFFMSIYLLTDRSGTSPGCCGCCRRAIGGRGREIFVRLDLVMRGWLESTMLAMVFVWLATWLGLTWLGLDEALALG